MHNIVVLMHNICLYFCEMLWSINFKDNTDDVFFSLFYLSVSILFNFTSHHTNIPFLFSLILMFCYVFQMVICKSISLFCNTWFSDEIWHIYLNIHMNYVTNKTHALYLSPFSSWYVPLIKIIDCIYWAHSMWPTFLVNTSHTSYAFCLQLTWITSTDFQFHLEALWKVSCKCDHYAISHPSLCIPIENNACYHFNT